MFLFDLEIERGILKTNHLQKTVLTRKQMNSPTPALQWMTTGQLSFDLASL
jgi:hypothetical protein